MSVDDHMTACLSLTERCAIVRNRVELARILLIYVLRNFLYYILYTYNVNVLKLWTYLYISYVLDYYRFIIDLWKSDML